MCVIEGGSGFSDGVVGRLSGERFGRFFFFRFLGGGFVFFCVFVGFGL